MKNEQSKLYLIRPSMSLSDEIVSYRQEFLEAGSSMDGCGALKRLADPADWLAQVNALESADTVPQNWVVSTQFVYVRQRDSKLVGMIQVRHCFNHYLEKYGGHIGYSIRPSERQKGYAKQMLRDCLPFCREIGLQNILITCLQDNEASRRTILANGGRYESTVYEPDEKVFLERYWLSLT